MLIEITQQNITDLIVVASQFVDDLKGLLLLLLGIYLGIFIVQSIVIVFTGRSIQKQPFIQEMFNDGIDDQRENELWP